MLLLLLPSIVIMCRCRAVDKSLRPTGLLKCEQRTAIAHEHF